MPSIYLVRHANYENPRNILPGRLPVRLSEEGIKQANKLKDYFTDKNISKIYSSAVLRCQQTAEIISAGKIPIQFDKRLLEVFSAYQGFWGENWSGEWFHFYAHKTELGGESFKDLQMRMANFWDAVTKQLEDNIIICSHGDPLATLYAYIYNLKLVDENTPEAKLPGWIEKGDFMIVKLENGKVVK